MNPRTVWMASYPKSGNTWLRAVAVAWRTGRPVDLNRLRARGVGSIASSRTRIEAALGVPSSLMTADEIDLLRPRVDEVAGGLWGREGSEDADEIVPGGDADQSTEPHLCKIHDGFFRGPAGEPVISVAASRGVVYVVRDPRDVALSYAHHNGWTHERAVAELGDPEAAMSAARRSVPPQVRQRLGTWSEHVGSWLDQTLVPVHVVQYEDCHRAPVPTFTAALRFAGFDAHETDVAEAVDSVAFDRLAAQEEVGGFRERPLGSDRFFRRGVAGAWVDELVPDLVARIEADHAEMMARLGYVAMSDAEGAGSALG